MEQLIKTIAPAWESTKIDSSRQSGEIGSQLRTILRYGRVLDPEADAGSGTGGRQMHRVWVLRAQMFEPRPDPDTAAANRGEAHNGATR